MISDNQMTVFNVVRDGVKSNKPVSYAEALDFLDACKITDADPVEAILENGLPFEIDSGQMWFERISPIAAETGKPSASDASVVHEQIVGVARFSRKPTRNGTRSLHVVSGAQAMTRKQTTEAPWECPVITGWMKNATLFGFVQINTQEPTLIMASTRMGMSYLVRQNNAKMDDIHE